MGYWKKDGHPAGWKPCDPDASDELKVLYDFGFFGHYLHVHAGGRSGKQHVLTSLLAHGGHMSQREMLAESGISSASLSEVLAKLEAEDLVTRQRSSEDGRQRDVTLTSAGTDRAREIVRQRGAFEAQCLSVLSADEKRQLVSMLDRLAAHWNDIEENDACPDARPAQAADKDIDKEGGM